MRDADFSSAALPHAELHAARDAGAIWDGADLSGARRTDQERLAAETFVPPAET